MRKIGWVVIAVLLAGSNYAQDRIGPRNRICTIGEQYAEIVCPADIDGDGDLDVVASLRTMWMGLPTLTWSENVDEMGTFAPYEVISTTEYEASELHAVDLDGDGDKDLLTSSWEGLRWYENLDGLGAFADPQTIVAEEWPHGHPADIDNDGDLDLFVGTQAGTSWLENTDGHGTFSVEHAISSKRYSFVHVDDLDGDGDVDFAAMRFSEGYVWFKNTDAQGEFALGGLITPDWVTSPEVADVDGDGDLDLMATETLEDRIVWYEHLDGHGAFGPMRIVPCSLEWPSSLALIDMDGDEDLDVVCGFGNINQGALWFENVDGTGDFAIERPLDPHKGALACATGADLDGDGDADLLTATNWSTYPSSHPVNSATISWFEVGRDVGFSPPRIVVNDPVSPSSILPADVNSDGEVDLIVAQSNQNKISWFENNGGSLATERIVSSVAMDVHATNCADIDGDGDQDLVFSDGYSLVWAENTDGTGLTWIQHTVCTTVGVPASAHPEDVDGDGDIDLVFETGPSLWGGEVSWCENTDGQGNFAAPIAITGYYSTGWVIRTADCDGDGDPDLLATPKTTLWGDELRWYENTDGAGTFYAAHAFAYTCGPTSIAAGDIDGDGDTDCAVAEQGNWDFAYGGLSLYGNDGTGAFSLETQLHWDIERVYDVHLFDPDGDGDLDLLISCDELAWCENLDGAWDFGDPNPFSGDAMASPKNNSSADFDGDGRCDAVAIFRTGEGGLAWFRSAPASATVRTTGSNPISLRAMTTPAIGRHYGASVDLGGHRLAMVVASLAPAEFPLPSGQVLLIDPREVIRWTRTTGTARQLVPDDPALIGREVYTQAVLLGGGGVELTNAVDLRLGY